MLTEKVVKVGILHSTAGEMAISETPVLAATRAALERRGVIRDHEIEIVVGEGHSSGLAFEREAKRLILNEEVVVVFGCWRSRDRLAVKDVFET